MSSYYHLLKEKFPTKSALITEMINLDAICHLPKGTEHFLSDLHGEYEAFDYLLRNGSGSIRKKIRECFPQKSEEAIETLSQYIYYPVEKIASSYEVMTKEELNIELKSLLPELIALVHYIGGKYTRSKVRKMFPKDYAYIMEELLIVDPSDVNKLPYFEAIILKITELGQLDDVFISFATLIQKLSIDHLHVVGDIFDRGPLPDAIIDRLQEFDKIDIQWGNHDITWIGAVSGSYICMMDVIRIAARYNSIELIEDRYGINLRRLIDYSKKHFEVEPIFNPILDGEDIADSEKDLLNKLQQATALLQFKLEHQLIKRRPEFQMEASLLFDKINVEDKSIEIGEQSYPLQAFPFEMINWEHPESLTQEEIGLLKGLMFRFQNSDRLTNHIDFLMKNGGMYSISNNHLLYHGCIPMHANGDFKSMTFDKETYSGKSLLDYFQEHVIAAYKDPDSNEDFDTDLFWYLWCGEVSSLFGKNRMTTFERYYIADKKTHEEIKNPYYNLRKDEDICLRILTEFGLDETAHIVNGHTPVKEKVGETPIKANGRMIIIDGGLAKGYQKKTGIAGYTLISNSFGLELVAHRPFTCVADVLEGKGEIVFIKRLVEEVSQRTLVKQTDNGKKLLKEIKDLEYLYKHFDYY